MHTIELANSSALLRCRARPKNSKWNPAARRERKKGALSKIILMREYML